MGDIGRTNSVTMIVENRPRAGTSPPNISTVIGGDTGLVGVGRGSRVSSCSAPLPSLE
jgi:hypothetical protein